MGRSAAQQRQCEKCGLGSSRAEHLFGMTIAFVLLLLLAAVVLFLTEKAPVDVIALSLVAALACSGILTPAEAFAGFGSEILVVLASIFVLSGALQRSGLLENLAAAAISTGRGGARRLTLLVMAVPGLVSAFMNNTTVTAMFLPPVMGVARRSGVPASRLLMPLSFASILGGTCTLIGTSTNVAVSGYIAHAGMTPLGMFEMAPIGLVLLTTGIIYMVLAGRRMLPAAAIEEVTPPEVWRQYLCELRILPGSPLAGQRAFDWELGRIDCRILKVVRGRESYLPSSEVILDVGDTLLVEGKVEDLLRVQSIEGIEIRTGLAPDLARIGEADVRVGEVIVLPRSELVGQTLREIGFRQRYGLLALALNHQGTAQIQRLPDVPIAVGDVLLVQGRRDRFESLRRHPGLQVLGEYHPPAKGGWRGWLTAVVFFAAIAVAGTGWVPLAGALLSAAIIVILTGAIPIEKAREAIDWRMLLLIGGMTALGTAMEKSGAASELAEWVVRIFQPMGLRGVLAGFFFLTILLTQPMSNAAAALVVLPVALDAAEMLDANGRTFAIAVMLAASISFIAPFEPSNLLVYGPGKYRIRDFAVVGGSLTVLLSVVVLWLLPSIWPLI